MHDDDDDDVIHDDDDVIHDDDDDVIHIEPTEMETFEQFHHRQPLYIPQPQ
jgi:hypothetical protein